MPNEKEAQMFSEGQHLPRRRGKDFPHPLQVEFPHITVAKQAVAEHVSDAARAGRINKLLDAYNTQLGSGYRLHGPEGFPGVLVPYMDVSINAAVSATKSAEEQTRIAALSQGRQVLTVEIGGVALPPYGYPFAHGDRDTHDAVMASAQVNNEMKAGKSVSQQRQIIIGYPQTTMGGEVTQPWIDALKNRGSSQMYAQNNAEIIGNILAEKPEQLANTKVVIRSVSMGALSAERTAALLVAQYPELAGHVQVMSQEPVINTEKNPVKRGLRGLQVAAGFLGEGIVHSATDKQLQAVQKLEKPFLAEMDEEFNGGLTKSERNERKKLQGSAAKADVGNLLFKPSEEPLPANPPTPETQVDQELEAIIKQKGDIPDALLAQKTPSWTHRVYRMYGDRDTTGFSLAHGRSLRETRERNMRKITTSDDSQELKEKKIKSIKRSGIFSSDNPGHSSLWRSSHLPTYRRVGQWDNVLNGRIKPSAKEKTQ